METTTAIKERPILFSTPMVKAILEGRKTVTRRVMNPQHETDSEIGVGTFHLVVHGRDGIQPGPEVFGAICDDGEFCLKSPYGQPGDILWVRETWAVDWEIGENSRGEGPSPFFYKATDEHPFKNGKWKPSIHMPRAACRLRLQIKSITVERLHDITEEDAIREGVQSAEFEILGKCYRDYYGSASEYGHPDYDFPTVATAKQSFETLWMSINGKESWEFNPWVWRIEFEKLGDKVTV
jgi:hypothetical protein